MDLWAPCGRMTRNERTNSADATTEVSAGVDPPQQQCKAVPMPTKFVLAPTTPSAILNANHKATPPQKRTWRSATRPSSSNEFSCPFCVVPIQVQYCKLCFPLGNMHLLMVVDAGDVMWAFHHFVLETGQFLQLQLVLLLSFPISSC
ncbi:hypothetical protein TcWFU_005682 [Taenia crassiceps]|uniref:Uncharacterized protein n=1 Tax=Taenia crassiceps TaxID=6207 RepID=A0ABR4QGU4_9CEST